MSQSFITEPFFFPSGDARLFGVWRSTQAASDKAWLVCPPFAEEEKSAHRTLVELCEAWRECGEASLFFALRGTGDSSGDFAQASLSAWRDDIRAAAGEIRRRAPDAELGVLGLRGGAALAAQMAAEIDAERTVLIEPLLNGRQYLSQMNQRRRLRAMMTNEEGGAAPAVESNPTDDVQDFDGWGFGAALREELNALDLVNSPPKLPGRVLMMQVGPKETIAAPLQKFADALQNSGVQLQLRSIVMQPFWNLLDYARADELIQNIVEF